jgi:hypothetical protein
MALGIWVALSLMWFVIDMTDDSSSIWFYWPMLGTGIAVAITGIVLLGIGGALRRQVGAPGNRQVSAPARKQTRPVTRRAGPQAHSPQKQNRPA